ncbi:methyl-accepting chemotaxis protein [Aquabacterium soli]|uniref:Methyl-accepting chemotaxis protein n=1 Tax=Aquabacterium soli TaxID=2493092 RepID=A0A426V2P9_9BURK|nr:methyl-accepting chemotaxis protein [Aquabacterium soli]RRS01137.1 methyl-accepting chemotaxis protein [Aquabacterium soli]
MNNFLNRLKLRTRLLLLAGAGLGTAACIAASALYGLNGLSAMEISLAEDALPSLTIIGDINDAVDNLRIYQMQVVQTQGKAAIDGSSPALDTQLAELKKHIAAYDRLVVGGDERKLFVAMQSATERFQAMVRDTDAKARSGDPAKLEAALDMSTTQGGAAFKSLGDSIDALMEFNNSAVAQVHAQAKETGSFAHALLWGILSTSALILVVIATVLTRHLTGQIGGEPTTAMDVARSVAQGDLTIHVPVRDGDTESLLSSLAAMQTSLRDVVADVRSNAESVATASAQIAQGNADLSMRTEQQASELQQTASSMEELGATVQHNAASAAEADSLAANATAVARQGGEVVGRAVGTMKEIHESSRRIADIIGVIDGIAFQTNILALNAAVEAARAGEQGRGFAVVAAEVRSLAQRSAGAAKEIKSLINSSVEHVEQGASLVNHAGSTMSEIVASIERVSTLVAEISTANREQSGGVHLVGDAITRMDQVTQQNAALVEESAAAAESLKAQASRLVQAVSVFQLQPAGAAT